MTYKNRVHMRKANMLLAEKWINFLLEQKLINFYEAEDCKGGRLFLSMSTACYDRPSSAILEFEGSPSRAPVMISGLQCTTGNMSLMVCGKIKTKLNSERHKKACGFANELIKKVFVECFI